MWIGTNHSTTKLMAISLNFSKTWKCNVVHITANLHIKYCHFPPHPDTRWPHSLWVTKNFGCFFTCKLGSLWAKSSTLTCSLNICFFPQFPGKQLRLVWKMPRDGELAMKSVLFLTAVFQTSKNVAERWMDLILRDVPQHWIMYLQCAGLAEWVCCLVKAQQCMLSWSVHLLIKSGQLPLI